MKIALAGDYTSIKIKALNDFMCESNSAKQVVFVSMVEEALRIFL
jgi:hypothetical protein